MWDESQDYAFGTKSLENEKYQDNTLAEMERLPILSEIMDVKKPVIETLNKNVISLSVATSKVDFSLVHDIQLGQILSEKLARKIEDLDIVQKAFHLCSTEEEVDKLNKQECGVLDFTMNVNQQKKLISKKTETKIKRKIGHKRKRSSHEIK